MVLLIVRPHRFTTSGDSWKGGEKLQGIYDEAAHLLVSTSEWCLLWGPSPDLSVN